MLENDIRVGPCCNVEIEPKISWSLWLGSTTKNSGLEMVQKKSHRFFSKLFPLKLPLQLREVNPEISTHFPAEIPMVFYPLICQPEIWWFYGASRRRGQAPTDLPFFSWQVLPMCHQHLAQRDRTRWDVQKPGKSRGKHHRTTILEIAVSLVGVSSYLETDE